jgi:hypothetical protein
MPMPQNYFISASRAKAGFWLWRHCCALGGFCPQKGQRQGLAELRLFNPVTRSCETDARRIARKNKDKQRSLYVLQRERRENLASTMETDVQRL